MESHRSFGAIHDVNMPINDQSSTDGSVEQKVEALRNDIVGNMATLSGPYGQVPCVYADWTASGRALKSVEKYVLEEVMPLYGNTHTTSSMTGHQSTCYRHEARQIVAEATNAKITGRAAVDVVVFTGNGTTAAIKKVVESLGLHVPPPPGYEDEKYRPVVFTSAYEHHSNLLPWRESVADVVTIAYDPVMGVSMTDLEHKLRQYSSRRVKVGTFAAASNVTGLVTAVDQVAATLHRAGAYAIFDYATAAPYVKVDMNPVAVGPDADLVYKDAVIFSGHKFLGGPGAPGVLVAKRRLLSPQHSVPTTVGGGTVFYVTNDHHRYLSNWEEREEGGTPHVVGDIRLGLALHVKQSIGARWIEKREENLARDVLQRLRKIPYLIVLGRDSLSPVSSVSPVSSSSPVVPSSAPSSTGTFLPIFPFLIRAGKRFLHHNFVCALLNDLFGVQSRGGCQCAGPFSQLLLGLDADSNQRLELALLDKREALRPGYSRLSVPFWFSQEEIDHVVNALTFVAEHGWKFLKSYRYQPKTGEWAHSTRMTKFPERKWLSHFQVGASSELNSPFTEDAVEETPCATFSQVLARAYDHLKELEVAMSKARGKEKSRPMQSSQVDDFEGLRWFALASDVDISTPSSDSDLLGPIRVSCEGIPLAPEGGIKNKNGGGGVGGGDSSIGTAYAQKRAETKMREERGVHSLRMPRYISLDGDEAEVRTNTSSSVQKEEEITVEKETEIESGNEKEEHDRDTHAADSASSNGTTSSTGDGSSTNATSLASTFTLVSMPQATGRHCFKHEVDAAGNVVRAIPVAKVPKKIMKQVGVAIKDWDMIQEGDRLLLGLSGGKDSLALLHVLLQKQRSAPVRFEIACATVDPQTDSFDPSAMIPYCKALGVTYHYLSEPIVELAKSKMQGDSLCAFCSRFKRGLLYNCCREYKYNKLVLAQHLDDLAESFIMSAFHGGQIRTMKANYTIEAGDVRVIRPLVYVREIDTRNFSTTAALPIINENCPACFEEPKERHRVKKLLQQEEASVPGLFGKLKHALMPLMDDDIYDATKAVMKRIEESNTSLRRMKRKPQAEGDAAPPTKKSTSEVAPGDATVSMDMSKKYTCTNGLCFEIA